MEKFECSDCGRKFDTKDAMVQHKSDKHLKQDAVVVKIPSFSIGKIFTYAIIALVILGIGYVLFWALTAPQSGIGPAGSTHIHQDWKAYLNGVPVDFSVGKYQKPHLNQKVHMEGGDGDVIHVHATGVTMGFFLESIGLDLGKDCFKMDTGEQYCNQDDKTLKFYVNGKLNDQLGDYILKDSDKILISYGSESEEAIADQLGSITDKANLA